MSNEEQEIRNYFHSKGFSVGDDSSVSSTEIDFEKGNYMDYLREKLEPKRKKKDDSAKKGKNEPGHSFLTTFLREAEESIELQQQ